MHSMRPIQLFCAAPRGHLFTPRTSTRVFSSFATRRKDGAAGPSSFGGGPSPPRLPKEEQDIFDQLQRQSTGAFSTPRAPPKINQSPDASASDVTEAKSKIESRAEKLSEAPAAKDEFQKIIEAKGKGEELHPNIRRGAQPEFEGDRNPKTGEIGGPKNEPLRWGAAGEWSYNGRTTDF